MQDLSDDRLSLSEHANLRLKERFKIDSDRFLSLLNSGVWKGLGVSVDTRKAHRLVWSQPDDGFIVAIQDVISRSVITVLTLDMYRNTYADKINDVLLARTINAAVVAGAAPAYMWRAAAGRTNATVYAQLSTQAKAISLGRWKDEFSSVDLAFLGQRKDFWVWVVDKMMERGLDLGTLELVTAKFSGGVPQEIPCRIKDLD